MELTVGSCNATPCALTVWLKPRTEEFELPSRSGLSLRCYNDGLDEEALPELEVSDALLAIYASGGNCITVAIDGVDVSSASSTLAAPDMGTLGTRGLVDLFFADRPTARPSGRA